MNYDDTHAERALKILRSHISKVKRRSQYSTLLEIAESPNRWSEAHACFTSIRSEISIPIQEKGALAIERNFAIVAELVAKTLYNCSGEGSPFDASTFTKLINAERKLIDDENSYSAQDNMGLGRGTTPKSMTGGLAQIVLGWFKRKS